MCLKYFSNTFELYLLQGHYFVEYTLLNLYITDTTWKVSKYGVFSDPNFPIFGLNMESYSVNFRIQSEYGKMQTRKNSTFGHSSHNENYHCFRNIYGNVLKYTKATIDWCSTKIDKNKNNSPGILLRKELLRWYLPKYQKCRTIILQKVSSKRSFAGSLFYFAKYWAITNFKGQLKIVILVWFFWFT